MILAVSVLQVKKIDSDGIHFIIMLSRIEIPCQLMSLHYVIFYAFYNTALFTGLLSLLVRSMKTLISPRTDP